MIHEEICTYEVCKLAKEKGFPVKEIECWYCEYDGRPTKEIVDEQQHPIINQSLLQRWLREEKGIHIIIDGGFQWGLEDLQRHFIDRDIQVNIGAFGLFDTYEEALHNALLYALQNV